MDEWKNGKIKVKNPFKKFWRLYIIEKNRASDRRK